MEAITAAEVRRLLPTSKHRLDDELERHADTQERIGAMVASRAAALAEAKDDLDGIEYRLADEARREAADRGVKVTVDQVNGQVHQHRDRLKAWRAVNEATKEHETWRSLYDAWRSKGFNMTNLGGLYAHQYFAVSSAGSRADRSLPTQEGRDAMARARRQLSEEEAARPLLMPRRERRRAS